MITINKIKFKYGYNCLTDPFHNSFMNIYLSNFCCLYSCEDSIGFSKSSRLYFTSFYEFNCADYWEVAFEYDNNKQHKNKIHKESFF